MFKRIKLIAVISFVFALVVSIVWLRSQRMLTVITYHSISPNVAKGDRLTVSPQAFNRQMQFLKKHKYKVIPLEKMGELIRDKKVPAKTVAITFDDGYQNNYVYAYPVIKKFNFPVTVFLVVSEIGKTTHYGKHLDWDEIKEMQASGLVTFGSHTLSHPYLTEIRSEAELKKEISDSKKILEQKLGVPVYLFCYPSGNQNAGVKECVAQAGYKFAVGTTLGRKFSNSDPYLIKRVRISQSCDNLFQFWARVSGYYNSFREHNPK